MEKLKALELTKLSGVLYDQIKEAVDKVRLKIAEAYADGTITFAEVFNVVGMIVGELIGVFQTFQGMSNAEKKEAIVELVDEVYKKDVAPLDITFVPDSIEEMYIDPLIGQLVHTAAVALVDFLSPK